jgi:hypothetical protein
MSLLKINQAIHLSIIHSVCREKNMVTCTRCETRSVGREFNPIHSSNFTTSVQLD